MTNNANAAPTSLIRIAIATSDLEYAIRSAFEDSDGDLFETLWVALCFIDGDPDDHSAFQACLKTVCG